MSLVDKYDVILFDCDGVLWRGLSEVPGAADTLKKLISLGKKVILVTNNNSKTRKSYRDTVKRILDLSLPDEQLYSSGISAGLYVKKRLNSDEKVFLIGTDGLCNTMNECGVNYIGFGVDMEGCCFTDFTDFVPEKNVKFVVGAFDPYFNYAKMAKAFIYIRECGAQYIATNLDLRYNVSKERIIPGTGSVIAGLTESLGVKPIVLGKPSPLMYEMISSDHKINDKSKVLMVGDNPLTDIQFAVNVGIDSALVLSGITPSDGLQDMNVKPTYILESVVDLMGDIPS